MHSKAYKRSGESLKNYSVYNITMNARQIVAVVCILYYNVYNMLYTVRNNKHVLFCKIIIFQG
jgi:hypothetical protein